MSEWRTLLASAMLAPSPHNVQPWRVRIVSDTEAELLIERARTLPREDVTGSFIILTMGVFVETLRIAAAHRGLALDDDPLQAFACFSAERLERQTGAHVPFARLKLRPDPLVRPGHPLERLAQRRTSRLAYDPAGMAPADTARLRAVAAGWGHAYHDVTGAARIERILAWNAEAVFEDLNTGSYRGELASWIRYTRAESERHRDGLDARCMNVPPLELWLMFHAPALLRVPSLRPWFRRRYRAQIGPVTTLGIISGKFWDPADAYPAGRFLTQFWLEVTACGCVLHPYGNLVTHRPIAARVEAETGIADIWLAFKIGTSPPPPSRRRSIEEVLVA